MAAEVPTNLRLPCGSRRLNNHQWLFLAHALSSLYRQPWIRPRPPDQMLLQREEPADKASRPALKISRRDPLAYIATGAF
jgi:hypothetical protein